MSPEKSKGNFLRRYTELPFLIDYLTSNELFMPSPMNWDDRNDSAYLEHFAQLNNHRKIFVLCLTEAPETYHHWKVFSSGSSGVCIEFHKAKFEEAIRNNDEIKRSKVQGCKPNPSQAPGRLLNLQPICPSAGGPFDPGKIHQALTSLVGSLLVPTRMPGAWRLKG